MLGSLTPAISALLAVSVACASLSAGYWLRGLRADREIAEMRAAFDGAAASRVSLALQQSERARQEEARRAFEVEVIARDAKKQAAQARRDASAADDAAGRLRQHVARLAAQCAARGAASHPAASASSPPAADADAVLADLFVRADEAAGALAAAADQAAAAGLACERAYDSLRSTP